MLILVYGDDTFRAQEKVAELKAAFVKKFDPTGMNVSVFPATGGKLDPGEALQAICSLPFLTPRRMVFVRELVGSTKKEAAKVWEEGLMRVPETTICVLWESEEPKALEKKPLFKSLKDAADVHYYPFPVLEGAELTKWTAARVKERGGQIDRDALGELVSRVGSDLWQMSGEIEKLVATADGKAITRAMVEDLVRASFEGEIFALMDAVSQKRPQEAIKRLQQERWAGSEDHYLLSMLARQVRILLGARAMLDENPGTSKDIVAQEMGVHPFVAQKALAQARGFTFPQLREAHELLFQYDATMKSGGIDADLAVDLVTAKLLTD